VTTTAIAATRSYSLEPVPAETLHLWDDLVLEFESREVFHRTAWLDYLAATFGLTIRRWRIADGGGSTVGYFCGGLVRKGPYTILGSPLKSWGTNVMGPLIDVDADQPALLRALDSIARAEKLAMIELEHPMLEEQALEAAGYQSSAFWTYLVRLEPGNVDSMWQRLDSTCRNRIRKAQRLGLVVEDVDAPAIVDEFYDQYCEVMHRKGLIPLVSMESARLLFEHLRKAGLLLALRVRDQAGRSVATGLFPHDDRVIYFWGGASREDSEKLCPNELLHWTAMCMAADRGLRLYNMSGHGRFKRKFGGVLTLVRRWHKSFSWTAGWARSGYGLWFQSRVDVMSGWQRLFRNGLTGRPQTHRAAAASHFPSALGRRQRPSFRLPEIWQAPVHNFPMRDEVLYQYLALTPELEVLEVGPGSGFTAFRLARHVRQLTLLDIAAGNIATLQRDLKDVHGLRFFCGDLSAPGLAEALGRQFDAVYALEMFEYVTDPAMAFVNLAKLLRSGGQLLLEFPNYPPPKSPGVTYFNSRKELGDLLKAAGFRSWTIHALSLRPYQGILAQMLDYSQSLHRRLSNRSDTDKPLIYDETWAFKSRSRLDRYKPVLHSGWTLVAAAMRLGGDCYQATRLGDDIRNRDLLVVARR
jgi:SAM-dependent methyltransferase